MILYSFILWKHDPCDSSMAGIEVQSIQQRARAQDVSTTDKFITEERKYLAQDVSTTDKEVLTEGQ